MDIQNKEFKKSFRGYNEDEVDEFLDEIMIHYERLYKENAELKEKVEKAHEHVEQYKNIEDTLKNTLVVAQSTADEVKDNASKKSQLIIEEAEMQSKEIIAKANRDVDNIRKQYEEIKKQMEIFKTRYRTLLQSQLETLTNINQDMEEL